MVLAILYRYSDAHIYTCSMARALFKVHKLDRTLHNPDNIALLAILSFHFVFRVRYMSVCERVCVGSCLSFFGLSYVQ